ncbi:MAG: hypothetical protein ABFR50_01550 [Candidatus Fermentibacteria bacterium]
MNILILLMLPLVGYGPWESVGPEGGQVKAVLQSTQNPAVLYAFSGAYPTQVLSSTDGGDNWNTISDFTSGYPYDMVMTESGKLVAVGSSRVWTSSDNGITWIDSYYTNTIFIDAAAHPADGEQVFASGYKYNGSNWDMTFYHSADAGATWSTLAVVATGNTSYGRCIDVSPSDPDQILIGGYEYTGSYVPHLFKSVNGGISFTEITPPAASYYLNGVAFHPTHPDTMLTGSLYNVFRSADGGSNWTTVATQTYNYGISFSHADNNLVMSAGSTRLYRSTNNGQAWSTVTSGLSGSGINWIIPDALSSSAAYTGSSAGFYSSSDGGVSWSASNSGIIVGKALAMEYVNGWIFMNMEDMGLFKAEDGSSVTWQEVTTPLNCGDFCALVSVGPDILLALEGGG